MSLLRRGAGLRIREIEELRPLKGAQSRAAAQVEAVWMGGLLDTSCF